MAHAPRTHMGWFSRPMNQPVCGRRMRHGRVDHHLTVRLRAPIIWHAHADVHAALLVQAFLACEKNENLAANLLFDQGSDMM